MQAIQIERTRYEAGFLKLEQLEALLACTAGLGFQHFTSLQESLQDMLMLLAMDLAHDAVANLTPH